MMDFKMTSGKMTIDDNGNTIVDQKTKEEIEKEFLDNEDNKDKKLPNMEIKD